MEIQLLGPVEVHAAGRSVRCGRPQQCTVLAVLAAEAGRPVSVEALVDRVWGPEPPQRARRLLHPHVSRIRLLLSRLPVDDEAPVRVERRAGGYVLEAAPDQVDLHRFRQLVERAAAGDLPAADSAGLLREALDLWRGEPLAGLSGAWVEATRRVWHQQRLMALVAWAGDEVENGRPSVVTGPLIQESADHPLVEPLAVALLRALAAAGRGAEALEFYAAVRRRLREELGADPGAELQAAHQAILRGEYAAPATATTVDRPGVPAQLPADVPGFIGRDAELVRLDKILTGAAGVRATGRTMVISAVSGTAGVGKTALAIRWCHRAAGRFPDGQLYVNMRGYDPDQPMSAGEALARFLDALGVAGPEIPLELDERAARYRSEISGRRMLVVLDNAGSVEQIRPLLPGTPACAVVVTSRDRLAGLVAVHGAQRIDLDLLAPADANTLLRLLIGDRAEADPGATATLAELCARLPLALRVAAELVVSRPATVLAELVGELADGQRRLDLLDGGGDARAAVSAVFSWSIRHLPPDAARMFRLLGLHPSSDIDAHAVAALADTGLGQARGTLQTLVGAHLVGPTTVGRYGMHDLLRAYASQLAAVADSDVARRAALGRLFDYYLAITATAMERLYPADAHDRSPVRRPTTPVPDLTGPGRARDWLDGERASLVQVAAYTAANGWPDHAVRLSSTLFRYLNSGYPAEALAVHTYAHESARQTGNLAGQGTALFGLGIAHLRLARYEPAVHHLRQAGDVFLRAGDQVGEARVLNSLGNVEQRRGHNREAADHFERALALFRHTGYRMGEAGTLTNLGTVEERSGRYRRAADRHEQALSLFREIRDRFGVAGALTNLGFAEQRLGLHEAAAEHEEEALALFRQLGNAYGEAWTLTSLGNNLIRLGRPEPAAEHLDQALALFRQIGERDGQAWALNGLGEAAHAAGRHLAALDHHTAALAIAAVIGVGDQQARAHAGLAHAHRALADVAEARRHYERALTFFPNPQSSEADDVRASLAALTHP